IDYTTPALTPLIKEIHNGTRNDSEIQFIAPNLEYIKCNAMDLPLKQNSIDVAREMHVFLNLRNNHTKKEILKQVFFVLKPNGLFISGVTGRIEVYEKKDNTLKYSETTKWDYDTGEIIKEKTKGRLEPLIKQIEEERIWQNPDGQVAPATKQEVLNELNEIEEGTNALLGELDKSSNPE
ncbi:MAG: methyltransferase domain-containing protein, partial [Candidatus Aenigmarchaeota archaeon]|nr:methyltransferase domain-containing protein [Candidatus Aenigmarchaeota archaeon]